VLPRITQGDHARKKEDLNHWWRLQIDQKYDIARRYQFDYHGDIKIEELAPEALRLSTKDRTLLAASLWESVEDPYDLAVSFGDEEAICLAKKLDEEIESGEVRALSHTELMNRLRR